MAEPDIATSDPPLFTKVANGLLSGIIAVGVVWVVLGVFAADVCSGLTHLSQIG